MRQNLALLLEDEESDRRALTSRLEEVGHKVTHYSNVSEAIKGFDKSGDIYSAYFLDMKVPSDAGEEPFYSAGLGLREHLTSRGVKSEKIFLMSGVVSQNDESAAKEFGVSPRQILAKDCFTEKMLRDLLTKS